MRSRKRVLVVDDNVDGADALAALLMRMGHEVRVAYDGSSALAGLAAAAPEIVLLDLALPQMSGYEVARRIRRQLGGAVRIVAVTAFGQESDRAQSGEAGFDQHLLKPVDPAFLQSLFGQA